jgi:hypothetical protein
LLLLDMDMEGAEEEKEEEEEFGAEASYTCMQAVSWYWPLRASAFFRSCEFCKCTITTVPLPLPPWLLRNLMPSCSM